MIHLSLKNMKEAFLQMNFLFTTWSMANYKPTENKFRNDYYLNAFNILMEADHCDTDLKLEQIGYTRRKADHLLRSYLDPAEYKYWMRLIKETTEKYHRVDSDIVLTTTKNSKHKNGPCLLGFSFRSHVFPVLTVYSRSVELPQAYAADTILIAAIGEHLKEELGLDTVKVHWYISSARVRSRAANFFRLFVYPLKDFEYLGSEFQKHVEKQWNNILADLKKDVSFSKLVRLQNEYKRIIIEKKEPEQYTGTNYLVEKLRGGDW